MNPQALRFAALGAVLVLEIAVFGVAGTNFFSRQNAMELVRVSVELGLLAVALTPVVVTGGIDLSVGSLLGLSAVVFGKLWRDVGLPVWMAAAVAIMVAGLCGALNGVLVARLRLPPLIVTLGTFSLFRGAAEGITAGVDNFTNFPPEFLFLGQGYLFGWLPTQAPIFVFVAVCFWMLLHRTVVGRGLSAIGFAPEGAVYAGLPTVQWTTLAYTLCGLSAGLAGVIYVAHSGQAKADAGLGYELAAVAAVVLGGTSIFGGRGSVFGTVLALFAIGILQNGLRLADRPPELAGVLTGVLLVGAAGVEAWGRGARRSPSRVADGEGDFVVKNSQVAALSAVILLAAAMIAGSNYFLVQSIRHSEQQGAYSGPPRHQAAFESQQTPVKQIVVAMMPKSKGNAYFISCRKGAEDAAKELGVTLLWDGPTDPDPAAQNAIVDTWITRGVDVIAIAVENRQGVSSVLRKARERGIKVVTWDADAEPDARDFFVNQATPEGIGNTLMDHAGRILGGEGEFAIITASLTAGNMIEWQKRIEARRLEKYPKIKMATIRPCDDQQPKAYAEANTILASHKNVKLIMAICSPAVPGAAEAVRQSGRKDVKVIGLSLPNDNKKYVQEGITEAVVLWKTADLGYLTVLAASQLHEGVLKPGAAEVNAGRLGKIKIAGDNILLGEPFTFTKDNIDQFDF